MALERINPFQLEDRFAVDHLTRYEFARQFAGESKVLDIACGLGFGTYLLSKESSEVVIGVDNDADTVKICEESFKNLNLRFERGDLMNLAPLGLGDFDLITCFETLEHVPDYTRAIKELKNHLSEKGLLIGSVPGETDSEEENEFHLHHFNKLEFEKYIKSEFKNVLMFTQSFGLISSIESDKFLSEPNGNDLPMAIKKLKLGGQPINEGGSIVFMASDDELPKGVRALGAYSGLAWDRLYQMYKRNRDELNRVHQDLKEKHDSLVSEKKEHAELIEKFATTLEWGKYHFYLAKGEAPSEDYLEQLSKISFEREKALKSENTEMKKALNELQLTILRMKDEICELRTTSSINEDLKKKYFIDSTNEI